MGEVPRRGGEGSDVSRFSNVATLSVALSGASSPRGGAIRTCGNSLFYISLAFVASADVSASSVSGFVSCS